MALIGKWIKIKSQSAIHTQTDSSLLWQEGGESFQIPDVWGIKKKNVIPRWLDNPLQHPYARMYGSILMLTFCVKSGLVDIAK